jgi:hypothetical protein
LSAVVALSALATIAGAVFVPARPIWALIGFELITLLAGGFGLAVAAGRFSIAPGLALACVAGTVLVASVFGYLGATGQIGDWKLQSWLLVRTAASVLLGLLAAWVVLRRVPGAAWGAVRGVVYAMAAIGFSGLLAFFEGEIRPGGEGPTRVAHALCTLCALIPLPACVLFALVAVFSRDDQAIPRWMRIPSQLSLPLIGGSLLWLTHGRMGSPLAGPGEVVRVVLVVALAIVLIGALSAGVHILISAFSSCADPGSGEGTPTPLKPTPGATSS